MSIELNDAGQMISPTGEIIEKTGEVISGITPKDFREVMIAGGIFAGLAYASYKAGEYLFEKFTAEEEPSKDEKLLEQLLQQLRQRYEAQQETEIFDAQATAQPQGQQGQAQTQPQPQN